MPSKKHYPPSYVRYQLKNPGITIHLNSKLKERLDAIKGDRSYAHIMSEILTNTFDMDKEIKRLPVSEAVISYIRGFKEAKARYVQWGICKKCGNRWTIWNDGICDRCHKEGAHPDFSYFRDSESAKIATEEDFEKAKVKLPNLERLSYENGKKRGYNEGWSNGYGLGEKDFKITYPCSVCGKPLELRPGNRDHAEAIKYLKENGWAHKNCLNH